MKILLIALMGLAGCSSVSARPGSVQGQTRAHESCSNECHERQKLCKPTDSSCHAEYRSCVQQCERFAGARTGDGQWGLDIPLPK